jgi:hypothetical protein
MIAAMAEGSAMRIYLYWDNGSRIFFGSTPADRAALQEVLGSGVFPCRDLKKVRRAMNRSGYGVAVVNLGQAGLSH